MVECEIAARFLARICALDGLFHAPRSFADFSQAEAHFERKRETFKGERAGDFLHNYPLHGGDPLRLWARNGTTTAARSTLTGSGQRTYGSAQESI